MSQRVSLPVNVILNHGTLGNSGLKVLLTEEGFEPMTLDLEVKRTKNKATQLPKNKFFCERGFFPKEKTNKNNAD